MTHHEFLGGGSPKKLAIVLEIFFNLLFLLKKKLRSKKEKKELKRIHTNNWCHFENSTNILKIFLNLSLEKEEKRNRYLKRK